MFLRLLSRPPTRPNLVWIFANWLLRPLPKDPPPPKTPPLRSHDNITDLNHATFRRGLVPCERASFLPSFLPCFLYRRKSLAFCHVLDVRVYIACLAWPFRGLHRL